MKRLTFALVLSLALTPVAYSQTPGGAVRKAGGDEEAVRQAELLYAASLVRGDVQALDGLFADDYIVTKSHGEVWDRNTHLAFIKTHAHQFIKLDVQDLRVRVFGNTAAVTGRHNFLSRDEGAPYTGQSRFTRVYIKEKGRWRIAASQWHRFGEQTTVSGEHTMEDHAAAVSAKPGGPAAPGVTNRYCPMSDGKTAVNPKIRVEHKGQYVYFASEGARAAFERNPEAAVARLSPEDRAAIKTNETCPYTGLKVLPQFRTEHEGKLVYFCCDHCKWEYNKIHGIT